MPIMAAKKIIRMTLTEARERHDRGETFHDPNAPIGPSLGLDFWKDAVLVKPLAPDTVQLQLEPYVYDFFVAQSGGKGHIKKMQQVLKAYVDAHK
jgi:hypothetical protein